MWSDFNAANRSAMMKSELFSWPVTLVILALAFGSLVAASLPLMLTIVGLIASAGVLYLGTLLADISIWSMNFALMFALALGIDYALFIVVRYRAAHFGHGLSPADAAGVAMDTAGKAVLFSGITVLISLSAVMLVPSPAFRSMALGIMISVVFILAATLTLLPAVLGALGSKVDNLSLKWVHSGEHRSPAFARWAERVWAKPLLYGIPALLVLLALAAPVLGLKTGMPSIKVVPTSDSSRIGYTQVQAAFGPGAPGALQLVAPASRGRGARTRRQARRRHRQRHADPDLERRPLRAGAGDPAPEPLRPRRRPHHRPPAHHPPSRGARRRRRGREPRPRDVARERHPARDRHRARARLPAPARRAAGADHRARRRAHQPARHRRRLRRRPAHLPGRAPRRPAGLRVAGLPRRLGAGVLLRDDLRDLDGLHRLPARLRQGASRALERRRARGDDRRRRPLRAA